MEREREWQEKPDSLCCLPWKSVTPLPGRLRMLMGIPFSPQSALKAQDNNLLLQVWLWLSHNTSFSPLTLNKKRWSLAVPVIWVLPSQLRWRYWLKHLDIYWICHFFFFFYVWKMLCPAQVIQSYIPAFAGVSTKGPDLLPHFLCEQTNQWNPCKAEYRFQSIRFNNILDTGLEEPAHLRVHLSLTLWEGQYPLLHPQLKLDCPFWEPV